MIARNALLPASGRPDSNRRPLDPQDVAVGVCARQQRSAGWHAVGECTVRISPSWTCGPLLVPGRIQWTALVACFGADPASRRAGPALPGRADLVQVERPAGRTTWTRSARSGGLRCATGTRSRPRHPRVAEGPGRVAPAAGGYPRVVGPEALPAGGDPPGRRRAAPPSILLTRSSFCFIFFGKRNKGGQHGDNRGR